MTKSLSTRRLAVIGAWLVMVMVCALLLGGALLAPSAGAAGGAFGGEGTSAGEFGNAQAVAVDNGNPLEDPSAGDVYIADVENSRIDKFSGAGKFLEAWGWGVADGRAEFERCGPAATPETTTCQAGIPGAGAGQLGEPGGIAVDQSPGLSTGDVYVEDKRNNRIDKFTSTGGFLLAWGWGVADGKAEAQICGPAAEPVTTMCLVGLEGTGPGQFGSLTSNSIAVGGTGAVYVGDGSQIEQFGENGSTTTQIALPGTANEVNALAIDAAGDFYAARGEFRGPAGVHKYDSSGTELATLDPVGGFGSAIAVGPSDEVFVFDVANRVSEYRPDGTQAASFPIPERTTGLAYGDQNNELYVLSPAQVDLVAPPQPGPLIESVSVTVGPMGAATVNVTLNPEGQQTKYHLEYGQQVGSETATATTTLVGKGFEPEIVQIKLTGLEPKALYHFHVSAENAAGRADSGDRTFTTLPPASIDSESVSQVSSESARLATTLNPLGLPTEYRFEYGTTASYGIRVPVPDGDAGSGLSDVSFTAVIEGLTAGQTYHYRVVAHNALGETVGPDHLFSTQVAKSSALIDGRHWEQVSPADKHGSVLEAITPEGGDIQAAEDGAALAYIARDPVSAKPAGNRSFAEQQVLATRGANGWSSHEITTPHENVSGLQAGDLSEYKGFSTDLLSGVVEPRGIGLLSPWASERTPYIRQASGEYRPLVIGCPKAGEPCAAGVQEHANVPAGTKFGTIEENGRIEIGSGVEFITATPDLNHVLLSAPQSLVSGFENGGRQAIYEWTAGQLQPVSILPGGEPAAGGTGAVVGQEDKMVRGTISTDGRRVSFQSEGHLFFRDMRRRQSVQLDAPEEGAGGSSAPAEYQYASTDGTRVLFTDAARLTRDSTANAGLGQPDLYMCKLGTSVDERSCAAKHELTDLTVGFGGETADVRGLVLGGAEDSSYVYFVANGILSNGGAPIAGAVRGDCGASTEAELCNVYAWHDGVTSLVAVLSGNDLADWQGNTSTFSQIHSNLAVLTARVSPNGRFIAFMSQRPLTGYDNRDAVSGARDAEVFLHDSGTGRTVCASCDPTGARPHGVREPNNGEENTLLVDRVGAWATKWVAGSIPGWTPVKLGDALYQSRYLSNEGRLFFNTPVSLVPADANGKQDVYEFEPDGIGNCESGLSSASATFVKEVDGCVGLISSGTASEESAFLDAGGKGPGGEEGEDVFYLTSAKLVGSDVDSALDVYDAHICTGSSPCPPAAGAVVPACTTTDSCKAAPVPQLGVFGAPASATFSGAGNVVPVVPAINSVVHKPLTRAQQLAQALKACKKGTNRNSKSKSKKRIKCERQARKRYGASTARRTSQVRKKAEGTARRAGS